MICIFNMAKRPTAIVAIHLCKGSLGWFNQSYAYNWIICTLLARGDFAKAVIMCFWWSIPVTWKRKTYILPAEKKNICQPNEAAKMHHKVRSHMVTTQCCISSWFTCLWYRNPTWDAPWPCLPTPTLVLDSTFGPTFDKMEQIGNDVNPPMRNEDNKPNELPATIPWNPVWCNTGSQ